MTERKGPNRRPRFYTPPVRIQAARRKAGVPLPAATGGGPGLPTATVHGEALIFWDRARPGKKRDAIDTDQITPSAWCVSESLDALDRRWKEGAFRYLMPDFREQVASGKNFVVAGGRFGIGSSREMSPAGLLGVAADAGVTLVLVLGAGVGDIFRRNALNLGLHVLECPDAARDALDGHRFSFDPVSRELVNESLGRTYRPQPLTRREEEQRRAGGLFAVGRRRFGDSIGSAPIIRWPEPREARRLTATEQILHAHRVKRGEAVAPGRTIEVYADLLPASDGTAPLAIHTFREITAGAIHPRQAAIANDHFVFTGRKADERQTAISARFAAEEGIGHPWFATPGDGIFHFYFPEQGLVMPGAFIAGADSHSRAYGAYGAVGIGVGSTALGFGWATGSVFVTPPPARRVIFTGTPAPWSSGKDVVLRLIAGWDGAAAGDSIEFADPDASLPISWRNTIANMMAEAEAWNGLFPFDGRTAEFYRRRGMKDLPYPAVHAGASARFAAEQVLDLGAVVPLVALPSAPGNAHPAEEVAAARLPFDRAYIGSCTNGSHDDLLAAALVIRAAREIGRDETREPFVIFPGSRTVKEQIERPEPRLGGETIGDVLRSVGGQIRDSWCGPCFGQGEDALGPGMRAITSFNRNWENRMGRGGEGFLASPSVVASSALLGYIGPPSELGLAWSPEHFGG